MLRTVEGVYQNGRIELTELPGASDGTRVLVTFLPPAGAVDLREHHIDEQQAAELRWSLQGAAEEWDRPEMSIYDESSEGLR